MAGEALLAPALLARLERVQLGTRRRLAGRYSGEHRSPRYGSSLDFADYREYHPGDDFRRIDYSLFARTDQLFIRLFEAEDDLNVRLVVDASASMGFHGKLLQASRLAAALGFVALVRRDAVQLHTLPSSAIRRFNGRGALPALLGELSGLRPAGPSDLYAAAGELLGRRGPAGLTVVFSDLMTPSWTAALERLPARGGDVTIVHVLAAEELRPDLSGDLDLVDAETGERLAMSLTADLVRRFETETSAWLDMVAGRCAERGVGYVRVLATDDLEAVLLKTWRREGVVR